MLLWSVRQNKAASRSKLPFTRCESIVSALGPASPPPHHNHHEPSKNYAASCLLLKESASFQVKHVKNNLPHSVFFLFPRFQAHPKMDCIPATCFECELCLYT